MGFTLAWCLVGDVSRRLCSRGFNGWCLVVGAFKVKKRSCVGFFVLVPACVLPLLVDGVVSSMAPACLELQALPLCFSGHGILVSALLMNRSRRFRLKFVVGSCSRSKL